MTQELTVALRIKAFLTEARQSVRDFNRELAQVGTTATTVSNALGHMPGPASAPGAAPVPPPPAPPPPASTPAPAPAPGASPKDQERDLQALIGALDPAAASAARLAQAEKTLSAALARGAIDQATYIRYLGILQAQHRAGAISAGQHAMAMRQLPAQITDIATSLASGMPPWLVFVQQGGQIRDSFGGGTTALKAMLSVLTPLRLAVAGVGGVLAATVMAYKQGSEEADVFNRAIVMTGNAGGNTASDLQDMAAASDKAAGTHAKAAEVLAQLAATGEVAREHMLAFTETAIAMERAGGQAASETVKHLEELGKRPLEATLKLNESLHYMTAALYDQLQALLRKGQEERAAEVAQQAYAAAMDQRAAKLEQQLGGLERAWRGVKDVAKEAWDAMLSVGRAASVQDQIASQVKLVEELERRLADRRKRGLATGGLDAQLGAARNRLQDLQQDKEEQASLARTQAEAAKVADEFAKARAANQRYADAALTKQEQLNKKLDEYRRNNERIRAGGGVVSDAQVKAQERAIYEEVYGKGYALEAAKAQAALQRATIEANLQLLQQSIKDGDAIIEQALKDGNVTIAAAYAARLSQITTEGAAQRRAYQAEIAEIDKALRSAKTGAERAPLLQQRVQVDAKVSLLDASLVESARKLGVWKTEQERTLSAITAKVRVDVGNLTGQFDRQAFAQQVMEGMRGDYEAAGRLPEGEQAAQRARLDMLQAAAVAQGEFNARLAEAQRLQGQLAVVEGSLQAQQQLGAISQTEAEARLRAARTAQLPALQQIVQQLLAIRGAMPPEAAAAIDGMTKSIGELQNQAAAAGPVVTDLGTRLRNTAIDGLADAAAQAVSNFRDLRSTVSTLLKQIAGDIVRSNIKRYLTDQFTPSTGSSASASASGGWLSALVSIGKSIFGYADGGLIRGPGTGTSDSVPALVGGRRPIAVSNEEFIQPQRAVKHYGVGFMEAVRTLKLPRPGFAFGGLVAAQQRARYATGGLVATGGTQVPSVVFQLVNNGTPQRVADQSQQFDGKQLVVSVVLEDVARGGPISRALRKS